MAAENDSATRGTHSTVVRSRATAPAAPSLTAPRRNAPAPRSSTVMRTAVVRTPVVAAPVVTAPVAAAAAGTPAVAALPNWPEPVPVPEVVVAPAQIVPALVRATAPASVPAPRSAPRPTPAAKVSASPSSDDLWDDFMSSAFMSSMVVLITKIVSAIGLAWLLDVPMTRQWAFGFFPYAGLSTTAYQFRRIATLSSVVVVGVVIVWTVTHLARQRRYSLHAMWGAFLAVPMVAFMVVLEWARSIELARLVETEWMLRIGLALFAAVILFVGFLHREDEEALVEATAAEPALERRPVRMPALLRRRVPQ